MMNELINKMELSEQNAILQKAKVTKGDLPGLLGDKGISYDTLRYEEYSELPQECLSPIETLDSIEKCSDKFLLSVSFPVRVDLMLDSVMRVLRTSYLLNLTRYSVTPYELITPIKLSSVLRSILVT